MIRALFLALPFLNAYAIESVASGAKVYIHPMGGFGTYVSAAFRIKEVPLIVVTDRSIADYEIVGASESQKASWAKIIFMNQTGSSEEASISVVDVRTSEVVFAYNYNTGNSFRGKQSASESCAKHLGNHIREGGRLASSLPARSAEAIAATRAMDYSASPSGQREAARERLEVEQAAAVPKFPLVRFTSNPVDAEIEVNGEYWGSTPSIELSRFREGSLKVVVKKQGFQRWERQISLVNGESRVIHAQLVPEPVDPSRPRILGLQ